VGCAIELHLLLLAEGGVLRCICQVHVSARVVHVRACVDLTPQRTSLLVVTGVQLCQGWCSCVVPLNATD
jgi:hypothetical protein